MAKLEIKIYPDKVLRKKAKSVEKITKKEKELANSMIETMRSANGVGLAAPQVGVSKRIIVIEAMEGCKKPIVLINPKILKKKGKLSFCEGCLSVPRVMSDIIRPEKIVMTALNIDGEGVKIQTAGLLARIIQHEIDHLEGILFIDKIVFLKRRKILKEISPKVCRKL